MSFIIRRAVAEDCPRLMQLIQELAEFEKEPDAVTVSEEHFRESGFGSSPVWWSFVAEVDGKVEGLALYYIRYSTWKGQRLYLEDLCVTRSRRGMGLGKALFERVIEEGKERGFNGLVWQVLDWNKPAIDFYRKYDAEFDQGWINCSVTF